jgi:hypothetical protein
MHANVVRKKEPAEVLGFHKPNYRRLQMNNNTGMIKSVAQQLAEMFKNAVVEQQKTGQGTPVIAQIEASLRCF